MIVLIDADFWMNHKPAQSRIKTDTIARPSNIKQIRRKIEETLARVGSDKITVIFR